MLLVRPFVQAYLCDMVLVSEFTAEFRLLRPKRSENA